MTASYLRVKVIHGDRILEVEIDSHSDAKDSAHDIAVALGLPMNKEYGLKLVGRLSIEEGAILELVEVGSEVVWREYSKSAELQSRDHGRSQASQLQNVDRTYAMTILDCDQLPYARAQIVDEKAVVRFLNGSDSIVNLYEIDSQGRRQLRCTLAPGDRISVETFLTVPWLATRTDGRCKAVYMPSRTYCRATIS